MKKIIQLSLFSLIVLIGIFFYNEYFINIDTPEKKNLENTENFLSNEKSNIIKNLRYDVSLDNNTKYNITSDFSELIYIDGTELVKMQNVVAIFIDENNVPLIIKSENAIFNNTTYNTNFSNNVKIRYLDNIIDSNKLDLNFSENIVTIYDNVIYEGLNGVLKTDNVKIHLVTKNVGTWEIVGLGAGVSGLLWVFTPLGGFIRNKFRKKELSEIETMHKETRRHIDDAFRQLEIRLSSNIMPNTDNDTFVDDINAELESLAFDLKKYVDEKHTQDLLNEKIPGDPRIQLKEHVEDSKSYTMYQLLKKTTKGEEE